MAGGGQGAGAKPGGQSMPAINPQSITDAQNLLQYYQQNKGSANAAPVANVNPTGYADGGMVQSGYNNFASPNQNFMTYQGQGQLNQPEQSFSPMTAQPPTTQLMGGPDATGNSPVSNMGFDGSGSDAGIGGQPVNQMQSPVQWQGNKPPSMSQFTQPQGLQIQGNPTSQTVQRPQQR